MQRARGDIARVAARDMPVLVLGESGSGKELVAQALHERSGRKGRLVAVNCGALPPDLVGISDRNTLLRAESWSIYHALLPISLSLKLRAFQHPRSMTL